MQFFLIQPHLFGKALLSLFLSVNLCLFRISTSLKRIICQEPHMYSLNGIFSLEASLWKILMFSHFYYYTTPKQTGSNLLSAKSWVPTRNRWMCPECGAKKARSIAWFFFGGSFWWWNFGPGSKWLKPSQVRFQKLVSGWLPKLFTPPRKKKMLTIPSMEAIRIWFSYEETAMVEPLQGRQSH